MNYILSMHILESKANLSDVKGGLVLRNLSFLLDCHQRPVRHELLNQVDKLLITEETIKRSKVSVIQKRLNFDLSHQMFFKFLLNNFLFLKSLDDANEFCCFFLSHIDVSK